MALFDTSYYSRKLFRRDASLGPFTEGDFRNPDNETGALGHAKGIASFGAGLSYVYRGARGAGYYPLSSKFWKPLAKVKEMNVERIIRRQYAHLGNKVNEAYIKELIAKTMRDGVSTDPVRRMAISNAKVAMTGIVDDMTCTDLRIAHTAKLNVLKIAGYQVDKPTDNKIINQNINVSAEAAVQMKLSRSALESMSLKYKEKKRV